MAKPPLEGIRVADFSWVWAGPFCTLQLAHLGADVIRIETKTRPCVTRMLPPWPENNMGLNRSGYFNQYNQGKRSITLNFKVPGAVEVAQRLVANSDVVVNNFAAGVMERLGFGYEQCRRLKPDIVMISLSGYGDTGPYSEYVAYGPAQVPLSGLSSLTGYKGWPPMHAGFSYADPNAGIHGAFAVLCALYHRAKTGEGQYLDMSQWECAMDLIPEGLLEYAMNGREPVRDGNRDAWMAPHGIFRCKDLPEKIMELTIDAWVSIVCADDAEFARLADAIGRPELATDARFKTLDARKRNEDELEKIITEWTSQRERTRRGARAPVPWRRGGGMRQQQGRRRGPASHRAQRLRPAQPSRSRRAAAYRNPVADERDALRGPRARAMHRAAYRRSADRSARLQRSRPEEAARSRGARVVVGRLRDAQADNSD